VKYSYSLYVLTLGEVLLRTNGEPFIAAYEVSADITQPKIIKHLENATTTTAAK
jgi:hypothetical protein